MLVDEVSFRAHRYRLRINKPKKLAIKCNDIRVGSRKAISATGLLSLFTGGASVPFDPPPVSSRERVLRRATGPSISRRRPTVAVAVAVAVAVVAVVAAAAAVRGAVKEVGTRTFKSKNGWPKLPTPG